MHAHEGQEWEWLDKVEAGDILMASSGVMRVVRSVSKTTKPYRGRSVGHLYGISLVILNCSWTGSCLTHINRSDLKLRKFSPTGKRKQKVEFIDKLIAHDVLYDYRFKRKLSCCDVKGVR